MRKRHRVGIFRGNTCFIWHAHKSCVKRATQNAPGFSGCFWWLLDPVHEILCLWCFFCLSFLWCHRLILDDYLSFIKLLDLYNKKMVTYQRLEFCLLEASFREPHKQIYQSVHIFRLQFRVINHTFKHLVPSMLKDQLIRYFQSMDTCNIDFQYLDHINNPLKEKHSIRMSFHSPSQLLRCNALRHATDLFSRIFSALRTLC